MSDKPKLPRIIYDPDSGERALEFQALNGTMPNAIDRRCILGCFETDLTNEETQEVLHKNVGALNVLNHIKFTSHSYGELRELLYPLEKDGLY